MADHDYSLHGGLKRAKVGRYSRPYEAELRSACDRGRPGNGGCGVPCAR